MSEPIQWNYKGSHKISNAQSAFEHQFSINSQSAILVLPNVIGGKLSNLTDYPLGTIRIYSDLNLGLLGANNRTQSYVIHAQTLYLNYLNLIYLPDKWTRIDKFGIRIKNNFRESIGIRLWNEAIPN